MTLDSFLAVLKGVPVTVVLTIGALLIGAVGAIPLLILRQSRLLPVSIIARAMIELFRGIPPIVWLFIIYFGLATVVRLDSMTAAMLGLGVISTAYLAEIYRGGLAAVAKGQWEASAALGMPRATVLARIVGPQVGRISVPAAATYGIGLLKDTSVAYTIGVTDVLYFANEQSRMTTDPFWPFIVAALVYIVMSVPCAWGSRRLDAALRQRVAR